MLRKSKTFLNIILKSVYLFALTGPYMMLAASTEWNGTGASTDLSAGVNWTNGVPNGVTVAEFLNQGTPGGLGVTTGPLLTGGIQFDASAPQYILTLTSAAGQIATIGGDGVLNTSSNSMFILPGSGIIQFTNVNGSSSGILGDVPVTYQLVGGAGSGITFLGPVTGNGIFAIESGATLTTIGASSVGSLGDFAGGGGSVVIPTTGVLTNGSLNTSTTLSAIISGGGGFNQTGTGTLILNAHNTYTGGTVINAPGGGITFTSIGSLASSGTLAVNAGTFDISVIGAPQTVGSLSGTGSSGVINFGTNTNGLIVNQTTSQTYAGTFVGTGAANFTLGSALPTATATLQLTGNSSAFTGTTTVTSGNLQVNGQFGGTVTVNSGGTLSGTGSVGTFGTTATINSGATLSPGNSVGTISFPGNLVLNTGMIYNLEENGVANNLALVSGTTAINGGIVNVTTTNGVINFNHTSPFITSTGALTHVAGFINPPTLPTVFNPVLYDALITYTANSALITIDTTFVSGVVAGGGDANALAIATQLDGITDPTLVQNTLLSELAVLPTSVFVDVLDDLSGAQYATEIFYGELANRQFIRRLYDPIRDIVTTEPGCRRCAPVNPCCEFFSCDVWALAGGGQTQIDGHSGVRLSEWDVTLGAQKTFCEDWTIGIAGSYEYDYLNYHTKSSGRGYSWFGGVYGLYRPSCYYVLADIAYGYSKHHVDRRISIDGVLHELKGSPQLSQVTLYGETGFDWNVCSLLIQPFVGVELVGFVRKAFTEVEVLPSALALNINKKDRTNTTSSLGVHLTDQFCLGFSVSVDLAWLYRFSNNDDFGASFVGFGDEFTVQGPNVGRSSCECAIAFTQDICDDWKVFVEASGEIWNRASIYNVLAGVQTNW